MTKLGYIRVNDMSKKEMQGAFDKIIDKINSLIELTDNVRGSIETSKGSENQIKTERIDDDTYRVSIRTKDGWAEQTFNKRER